MTWRNLASYTLLFALVACQSVGEGSRALQPVGEMDPFRISLWAMEPGSSRVVSAGAVRLCILPGEGPVEITGVHYEERERLRVNAWAAAPQADVTYLPNPETDTLTAHPEYRDDPAVVATPCDAEDVAGQTSFGWEATWLGPDPGIGKLLVIEYLDDHGNAGSFRIDSELRLCRNEADCEVE